MDAIGGILLVCFGLGWILLSFHYARVYWEDYNWAWGILIFIGCCMFTPFLVYFVHKLGDV